MTTALSAYGTNTTATTINTATLAVSVTGAANNNTPNIKIGTSTGYSEVIPSGTASAWQALGSIGSPSGKGWLLDATTLEGQQLITGTYTAIIRSATSVGTATVDMSFRVYKRSSGGVYSAIGTLTLSGQSLTTTLTTYTLTGSLSAMSFVTGDKLYCDLWYNCTANSTGSSTANVKITNSNSATQGRAGNAELDTPGYVSSTTTSTRTITSTAALQSTKTRTISTTAALELTKTRTISTTAALELTKSRTVPTSAALLSTKTRAIPGTAALLDTRHRTIPSTAALQATRSRTVPTTAAIEQVNIARTIPTAASLQTTRARSIPSTASLIDARTIPTTAALMATRKHTIPTTAALYAANAVVYVRSGQAAMHVHSGQATARVRSGQATLHVRSGQATARVTSEQAVIIVK